MIKIKIVCVGKIKEKYLVDAILEYSKRLSKYVNLEIIEVSEEQTIEKEGQNILKRIDKGDFCIALAIEGKMLSSVEFSKFLSEKMVFGESSFCFVIGGSEGLSSEILKRANYKLSFSKMTFPHQLMRVILVEQIYRTQRILNNEPYHK